MTYNHIKGNREHCENASVPCSALYLLLIRLASVLLCYYCKNFENLKYP